MLQELQERKSRYTATVHDTNSVGLTQLLDEMICTSQNEELSKEITRNCTEVSLARQNIDISRTNIVVFVEKLLQPFTVEEFLIPDSQLDKLGQIIEWQPDYQPSLETKITSSSLDPVERPYDVLAVNTLATNYYSNAITRMDNESNRNDSAEKEYHSGESNIEREISSQSSMSQWQHELQSVRMSCDESFDNCSPMSQISPDNKPESKENEKPYTYIQSTGNANHDIHCKEQNINCLKLNDSEYLKQAPAQVDLELTPARYADVTIVSGLQRDSLLGHACERSNLTDCQLRDHSLLEYMSQFSKEVKLNSTEFQKYAVDIEKANDGAKKLNDKNAEHDSVETTHNHNEYIQLRNDNHTRKMGDRSGTSYPSLNITSVTISNESHSDFNKICFNKIAAVDCDYGDPGDIAGNRIMNVNTNSTDKENKSVDDIEVYHTCVTSPMVVTGCDEEREHVATSEVKQLQICSCAPMYFDADLGNDRHSRKLQAKVLLARKKDLQQRGCIDNNTDSNNSRGCVEQDDHICTNIHLCGYKSTQTISCSSMKTSKLNIQNCVKKLSQPIYQNLAPPTCQDLKSTNEVDVEMRIVSQNKTCAMMDEFLDKKEFVSDNRCGGSEHSTHGNILLNSQANTKCNKFNQPLLNDEHVLNPCSDGNGNVSKNKRHFIAPSDNCTQPLHVNMSFNTLEFVPQLYSTSLPSSYSENSFLGYSPIQYLDKNIGKEQGNDIKITNGCLKERIGNEEPNHDSNIPVVTSALAHISSINAENDKIEEETNKKHDALCLSDNFTGECEMPKSKATLELEINESCENVDFENQLNTSVERSLSNCNLSVSNNNSNQLFSKIHYIKCINAGPKKIKLPDVTDDEFILQKRAKISILPVQHNAISIFDKMDLSSCACIASHINDTCDKTNGDTEIDGEQLTIASANILKQPNSNSSEMEVDCGDIRENACTTTNESKLDISDNDSVQLLTSCEAGKVHVDGYSLRCKACALNDKKSLPNNAKSTTSPSLSNMHQLSLKRAKASNHCKNSMEQSSQLIIEKNKKLLHCEKKNELGSLLFGTVNGTCKFYRTKNVKQTKLDGNMIKISHRKSHVVGSCSVRPHSDTLWHSKLHQTLIKEKTSHCLKTNDSEPKNDDIRVKMINNITARCPQHTQIGKDTSHHFKTNVSKPQHSLNTNNSAPQCNTGELVSHLGMNKNSECQLKQKGRVDKISSVNNWLEQINENNESNDTDVMMKKSERKCNWHNCSCIKNSLVRQMYDHPEKESVEEVCMTKPLLKGKEMLQYSVIEDKPSKTSMKIKGFDQSPVSKDTDVTVAITSYWKIFDADSNHNSKHKVDMVF